MENKYLSKMVIKPDYVVFYNEKNNSYVGVVKSNNMYNENSAHPYIAGYAASKNHPDEPLTVHISISNKLTNYYQNHMNIHVYTIGNNGELIPFAKPHDLFVYQDRQIAIYAGKEMALQDLIENAKDVYGDVVDKTSDIIDQVLFDENSACRVFYDKCMNTINDLAETYSKRYNESETKKTADDFLKNVKNFAKTAKTAYKTAKKTYTVGNKIADTVKENVEKATNAVKRTVGEVKKEFDNTKTFTHPEPTSCPREDVNCTYAKYIDKVCVILKHKINCYGGKEVHKYYVQLDDQPSVSLTDEQFYDIYEILNSEPGKYTLNSIIDVYKKPEKKFPIQMCQFRDQDIVKHEPKVGTAKFNVGDRVVVRRGFYGKEHGKVVNIKSVLKSGKTRNAYVLHFDGCHQPCGYEFFSYELDKE